MIKVTINDRAYLTNVNDPVKLNKCIEFFREGCSSFAISFNNHKNDIIQEIKLKGHHVAYLKRANLGQLFIPIIAKDADTSEKILKKGLDLIEIL